jgi:SAM-dependent methyltransferase
MWDGNYDWPDHGDEWSVGFGGPSWQWWCSLFPRIHGFLPVGTVLEIAPGYGRWTQFLKNLCTKLIIVDISARAVEHCVARFADAPHVSAHMNDGRSLAMVADESIDLVFSFDSLVHVELDVMQTYLEQISRKLTPNGVAFLHHSNLGSYPAGLHDSDALGWRGVSVSAEAVEAAANAVDLSCVSQETIAWGNDHILNDCISVITRQGSRWDRKNVVIQNIGFTTHEIVWGKRLSAQYPTPAPYGGL